MLVPIHHYMCSCLAKLDCFSINRNKKLHTHGGACCINIDCSAKARKRRIRRLVFAVQKFIKISRKILVFYFLCIAASRQVKVECQGAVNFLQSRVVLIHDFKQQSTKC